MGKARISVGVDDATGQPENAARGPYITAEDDGTRPTNPSSSGKLPSRTETQITRESELGSDVAGGEPKQNRPGAPERSSKRDISK